MIELIQGFPENVLAFTAKGEVTGNDYTQVLVPAIERTLTKQPKVRLLYQLGPEFTGFSGAAAWEDAKIGMKHLTSFDRIAVVTDRDWIENMTKAIGFALPCEVKVFDNDDFDDARTWITSPPRIKEFSFELLREQGVLVLRPGGPLLAQDFQRVAAEVDPYIEQTGGLRGILIFAETFPGWNDFSALSSHLRFVKDHHQKVGRVAFCTDDKMLAVLPRVARHFVGAEIRVFEVDDKDDALAWASQTD